VPSDTDLIIPALDERATIERLFDELEPLRAVHVRNLILADNGSRDGTPEAAAARGAVIVREPRRGYGGACLRALEWIAAQPQPPAIVAFIDGDLADDPAHLPRLLEPIRSGSCDIAIGSRVRRAEPGALNTVQRAGNRLACALMAALGGRRYTDLGPFRAVAWPVWRRLGMADRTWGWTVELQMKAAMLGLRVLEIDVPYRRRPGGRSKISGTVRGVVVAGTKIIVTIVALRLRRSAIRRAYARAEGVSWSARCGSGERSATGCG
jgi:glycosyltransferase involved in cell wall biosynthesis